MTTSSIYAFRPGPSSQAMTANDFIGEALDNPFEVSQGLSAGLMDTFRTSTSIGLMAREAEAPDLAKVPVAGGRGGVQWRDETEIEVANRGDKLLDTEEKQRQSPYNRKAIPHESGMTESRLKFLAEEYDTSQVRRHYMEKRPYSAFVGGLIGSIADPINFIPIVGEAGTALAIGKAGRISGRALVGAADATISTAFFDAATLSERAKYGDPMTWDRFAMDLAFSALAGSVIGGTIGVFSKEGGRVNREAIISSMTEADKSKAAIVFNDAIESMISYGEVRLGPASQEFSRQVGRTIEMNDTRITARQIQETRYAIGPDGERVQSEPMPDYAAGTVVEAKAPTPPAPASRVDAAQDSPQPGEAPMKPAEGMVRMYHGGNEQPKGGFWFSSDKTYAENYREGSTLYYVDVPESHPLVKADEFTPEQTVKSGFTKNVEMPEELASKSKPYYASAPQPGEAPMVPTSTKGQASAAPLTTRANYSGATVTPEQVTFKSEMRAADSAVENIAKTSDPIKLETEELKAEGIDIETGEHGLEDDVNAIVETMDDATKKQFNETLEEADLEFEKVVVFGEVLDFARTCFIR